MTNADTNFNRIVQKYNSRLMKDFQINQTQACGIWGNLGHESVGMTTLQEITPTVKGSKGGYGWMQWTGPRRRKFEAWCQTKKLAPASDEANYQYLVQETLTDEWKSIQQVRKTTTIEAATETFMLLNLRPGVKHLDKRISWAKKAQKALATKPVDIATTTTVGTAAIGTTALIQYGMQALPWVLAASGVAIAVYLLIKYLKKDKNV